MNAGLYITVYFLFASVCTAIILPCEYEERNPSLYRQLEEALLNNPNGLHSLHIAFFRPNKAPREAARIDLKINYLCVLETNQPQVEHTPNISDNKATQLREYNWTFKWCSSAVLSLINVNELIAFDNVLVPLLYSTTSTSFHHMAHLTLHVTSPHCNLADTDIFSTTAAFLTRVKAYARDLGRPIIWRDEDRGYVSLEYNYWITDGISDSCGGFDTIRAIYISLLVAYISLNVLIPIILMKVSATYYFKISRNILMKKQTPASITFWAAVVVLSVTNTLCLIISIVLYVERNFAVGPHAKDYSKYHGSGANLYSDCMAAFAARIVIIPLVYTFELLIAARIPKDTGLPIPSAIHNIFFCCRCFSSSMRSKIIQTLAIWQIMIFIQGLTMNVIPIGIFLLIDPLWSISVLGTFACILLVAVVIVAHLMHQCTAKRSLKHRCKRYTTTCLMITGSILSSLICFPLLVVYMEVITISGGAIGFLGSFLPPVTLSVIGWCLKKKLSERSFQETSFSAHAPQEDVQLSSDTEPLIDLKDAV